MTKTKFKFGGNGKVLIDQKNQLAIKTLKNPKNSESKKRFLKELNVLKELEKARIDNVVEIKEINEKELELTMPLYDGDLNEVLSETICNPKNVAELVLPIVKALHQLSQLDNPIYHRDLKPANILVKRNENGFKLFLADFGCAYFNDNNSNRQTPQFRAVGAQSYRAPEYDYGRVEEIDEKGDVYSLGKIIWCMINGVKYEVFPYTLWFPKEYNLEKKFPDNSQIVKANLLISACVDIDPQKRPGYKELIELLEDLRIGRKEITKDEQRILAVRKFEANRSVKETEYKALVKSMLSLFYEDTYKILVELNNSYKNFTLIEHLKDEFEKTYKGRDHSIEYKVKNDVESYISSFSFRNFYLSLNYHKSYSNKLENSDKELPHISCWYKINSSSKNDSIQIYYWNKILMFKHNDSIKKYNESDLLEFFENLVNNYISSDI